MPHSIPSPDVLDQVKSIRSRSSLDESVVSDYNHIPNALHEWYATQTEYPEWIFQELQLPQIFEVPSTTIGAFTRGAYFPGAHVVWLNDAPWLKGMGYGKTMTHEVDFHAKGYGLVAPEHEEVRVREGMVIADNYATDQYAFGAWHP